jgi:hypothetical protein
VSDFSDPVKASRAVHWILRWSVWACFVGHGMFGIRQKADWMVFFEPFGVHANVAAALMPLVGLIDVTLGYLALLRPSRAVYLYTAFWGVFTAALRPLVSMSVFETMERAGNYGPSLALLLGSGAAALLSKPAVYDLSAPVHYERMRRLLTVTTFLLLLGHGALAASGKPLLVEHWHALGIVGLDETGRAFTRAAGYGEVVAAGLVLLWPTRWLCLAIVSWKGITEALFLVAGAPVWEFVERGGSYGAPLALFVVLAFGATRARARVRGTSGLGSADTAWHPAPPAGAR